MLKPDQKIILQVTAAACVAVGTGITALVHRSFLIENKAMALGHVVLANVDKLSEEDIQHLTDAGMNFTK